MLVLCVFVPFYLCHFGVLGFLPLLHCFITTDSSKLHKYIAETAEPTIHIHNKTTKPQYFAVVCSEAISTRSASISRILLPVSVSFSFDFGKDSCIAQWDYFLLTFQDRICFYLYANIEGNM